MHAYVCMYTVHMRIPGAICNEFDIRVRDLMPERDMSSLRMWVSWGWAAWTNCSRRVVVAAVALVSTKGH